MVCYSVMLIDVSKPQETAHVIALCSRTLFIGLGGKGVS